MKIANNIIKDHLKNVYFLCGGAYGGKTTMAKLLEEKGVSCTILNMHTIKPLDKEAVYDANKYHKLIVTAEEHSVIGGLYGAVAEVLCKEGVHKPVLPIGINDLFVQAGSYNYQMQESGLTAEYIKDKTFELIENI